MKQAHVFASIAAFLVGTVFGSGGVWEWQKNKLESQKQEIERAVSTTDLREKENDEFTKILDLTNEYIKAADENRKAPSPPIEQQDIAVESTISRDERQLPDPRSQTRTARRTPAQEYSNRFHSPSPTDRFNRCSPLGKRPPGIVTGGHCPTPRRNAL
jgi:hypothetical protein